MADDIDKFVKTVDNFQDITWNKLNLIIKSVSSDLFNAVINDCPVDSGRAQNSWNFTSGTPNFSTLGQGQYDKTGEVKRRKITNELKRAPAMIRNGVASNEYYLANGLPYIGKLEYGLYFPKNTEKVTGGYSSQAVGGFVRKNLQLYSKVSFSKFAIKG